MRRGELSVQFSYCYLVNVFFIIIIIIIFISYYLYFPVFSHLFSFVLAYVKYVAIISRIISFPDCIGSNRLNWNRPCPNSSTKIKGENYWNSPELLWLGGFPTFSGFAVHGIPSLEISHQEVGFGTSSDGNQIGFYTQLIHEPCTKAPNVLFQRPKASNKPCFPTKDC